MRSYVESVELTKEKGIAIAAILAVIIMATAVFPFWNLFPRQVTETVKVVSVDQNGCVVETADHFIIKLDSCDGKPGDNIIATFDGKIKDRARAFLP